MQRGHGGVFSQVHASRVTVDGSGDVCAEDDMHDRKTCLFSDSAMAERMRKSISPHGHKLMGQSLIPSGTN
jgi:predicted NAD-dependent protein-ADP-ribosyltransferase YbiA (DUF1768 family)